MQENLLKINTLKYELNSIQANKIAKSCKFS